MKVPRFVVLDSDQHAPSLSTVTQEEATGSEHVKGGQQYSAWKLQVQTPACRLSDGRQLPKSEMKRKSSIASQAQVEAN